MKHILYSILLLLLTSACYGQLTNVGSLVIGRGGSVVVNNSVVNSPRSSNYYSNNGNLYLTGNFTNNQSAVIGDTGTTTFRGTILQTILGSNTAYFYHAVVNNVTGVQLQQNAVVNGSFSISAGTLAINGRTLTLNGTTSLTGSIKGSASSNLVIGGTTATNTIIKLNAATNDSLLHAFTVNRPGGTVTLGSQLGITKLLSLTTGTVNMNGKMITLKSVSIDSTAQVGPVGGTIDYTSGGSFTVERIIPDTPTNKRAYRDIGPGVYTTRSVFQNWQENGTSPIGYGIYITGVKSTTPGVDAASGLDRTISGNLSMHTYLNGAWSNVTNTKTLVPDPYQGYRVLVRGDRTFNMNATPEPTTMNRATIIRTNGRIITGTVTFTTTGIVGNVNSTYHLNNNSLNAYSLIANPYACAIDWTALTKTNLLNTYWYLDPTIGTSGSYVTCDGAVTSNPASKVNRYIQPGQAFFVRNNNSTISQLQIMESNKVTNVPLTQVFKTSNIDNRLYISLYKTVSGNKINLDGAAALFKNSYSNDYVFGEDAGKITNTNENMAWYRSATNISIERRSVPAINDTLPVRLWQLTAGTAYNFAVDARHFATSLQPYIWDKYTDTKKHIAANDTTGVVFTPTSSADTYQNRFYIVFGNASVLPVNDLVLKAEAKSGVVFVKWSVSKEYNVSKYEVERSADGQNFVWIGSHKAMGRLDYELRDEKPLSGNNYYRIKVIDADGSASYSKIAAVTLESKGCFTVYPNPLRGENITVSLKELPKGRYTLKVFNNAGQEVFVRILNHRQTSGQYAVSLPKAITKGMYQITIFSQTGEVRSEMLQIE